MTYFFLFLLVLVSDQISKLIVQTKLYPFQSINVLKDVFSITYVRNFGAAFGILQSQTWLLIALSVSVILFVVVNRHKLTHYPGVFRIGLAVALGGAVSNNLVDRIRLGYVVDFLDFHFWPVFNIADIAIVSGVGLIILGLYLQEMAKNKRSPEVTSGPVGREDI